ncbi:MAG: transposon TnsA [Microbacteriaceae bacterium]|jgi:membrane protein|nr:transposon TnsA [Microbacteriaceae bacterium]
MAQQTEDSSRERAESAPSPDDDRKPDSPDEISKPGWKYIARKTAREFTSDQAPDLAAALTYYGVLAAFPALLAIVSLLGVVGDAQQTANNVLDLLGGFVPQAQVDALREPIEKLTGSPAAGFALITGIVGALWSASGYVGAFSRAMNRVYGIDEGRPFWKLRPMMLVVTVIAVVGAVLVVVLLVASGPVAEAIGASIGLGDTAILVWSIVKWPVIVAIAIGLIAVLYYATPNVKQPKFRWMSIGALVALIAWVVASVLFALYVVNFSSYNSTYGSIGGVIVFLLWVWITNIALLFGAELDAEMERGRELLAGMEAEQSIQLPPRDTKKSDKAEKQRTKDVDDGRDLRLKNNPEQRASARRRDRDRDRKDDNR